MKKYSFLNRALTVIMLFLSTAALFTSCKEDIDESNLYTFTGETIEDYLANREDQFGSFNYILKRIGEPRAPWSSMNCLISAISGCSEIVTDSSMFPIWSQSVFSDLFFIASIILSISG